MQKIKTKHKLTPAKAKKILKDKSVKGRKLTAKQKRFFGYIVKKGVSSKTKGKKSKGRK